MTDEILLVGVIIIIILTAGSPDLLDSIIYRASGVSQCEQVENVSLFKKLFDNK